MTDTPTAPMTDELAIAVEVLKSLATQRACITGNDAKAIRLILSSLASAQETIRADGCSAQSLGNVDGRHVRSTTGE